jgi:hypothetical protein
MACAVESVVSKLPQTLGMKFRCKVRSMLDKSESSRQNYAGSKQVIQNHENANVRSIGQGEP